MEIIIILLLTLINGFFALSEVALISVKNSKIEHLAEQGNKNAKTVLELLAEPESFLSSVQVGITLIGIVAGAYGGATLTSKLVAVLEPLGWFGGYTENIAIIVVIGSITYLTIVIGELLPKTIAMNNPEPIALFCAPIIKAITKIAYPFVKLLSFSTQTLLKILGIKEKQDADVSEEEIQFMLKTAQKQGVLEKEESKTMENIFSFTDQTAKSLLTHRTKLIWLNTQETLKSNHKNILANDFSKYVVAEGSLDNIIGIITAKDFLENYTQPKFNWNQLVRKPIYVTENTPAFDILNTFKKEKQYIALVVDEYGVLEGIITLHDLFEAIIGYLPESDDENEIGIIKRKEHSYLVEGKTLIFDLNRYFQNTIIEEDIGKYTTLSGFLVSTFGKIPQEGEILTIEDYTFEILDKDEAKIDKVLIEFKPIQLDNN